MDEIKTLLQYLQHSTTDNVIDDSTRELHEYVSKVKISPEVREEYMRFEELIAFERKEAVEEAREQITKVVSQRTTIQNIFDLLEDYGEIPDTLKQKLEQSNSDLLRKYLKLAAKSDSIEAFIELIE